jgi:hypothetical protein
VVWGGRAMHLISDGLRNIGMALNSPKRRTPEEIRAGNLRLGLIMLAVAAAFFVGIFVKQSFFS